MRHRPLLLAGLIGAGAALGLVWGGDPPPRVHVDGKRLEEAVVEANRVLLREEPLQAREALDRADAACRRVTSDEEATWGAELVNFDRAFHLTLDQAREYATAGRTEDAFNQLVWVQRSCLSCHRMAREAGLRAPLPSRPPAPEVTVPSTLQRRP